MSDSYPCLTCPEKTPADADGFLPSTWGRGVEGRPRCPRCRASELSALYSKVREGYDGAAKRHTVGCVCSRCTVERQAAIRPAAERRAARAG